MVDAITNTSASAAADTSKSATAAAGGGASLRAQLSQYQHQLSDCVNCDSASTTEGKAQIAEISAKIAAVKRSLESAASSAAQSVNPAHVVANTQTAAAVKPPLAANLTVGVHIDLYS
ncbi:MULTISPECIES: FlxA-like family protein [unclassified Undibacterium]|nr:MULTISPECIES: FlxA-like family protein [unclassified Undibacterium]MEB0214417.1 FlxA-like family protein [Undibacterium sp. 5I2]WPX44282.1 FlxA-like family protein [Undibacterium sp. CCC3.4]